MEIIHDGYFKLVRKNVTINGKEKVRESLIIPNAVGAIVKSGNKFGFVKQFRPVVNEYTIEIVAGIMDKDLDEVDTLIEEMSEEMSINKDEILSIKFFTNYYMSVGYSNAEISLYVVEVVEQSEKLIIDNDVEEVIWLNLEQVEAYAKSGKFKDAKTFACSQYILNNFK